MDKIDALEDLLPGFQKFLDDLCQIKLTSDLEEKAQSYSQRITDYIQQFSSQPSEVPPPLPETTTLPRDANSLALEEKLREEREKSRSQFAGTSNTLPTLNGHSHLDDKPFPDELKRMSAPPSFRLSKRLSGHFSLNSLKRRSLIVNQPEEPEEDLYYEAPMEKGPPPVPESERPIRQIDDQVTYDDPESPPPVTGLPPSLPRPNSNQGYHVLNPDGQDSGGTFSIGTGGGATTSDGEIYDDIDQDDDGSFSDYDSDELEELHPDPGVHSPGGKDKKKSKDKQDDWQNFLNFIESQNNRCDHIGLLSYCDSQATLMKVFRPKMYYCAATNSRLLCYDPKKKYKKTFLELQLHSGCEISSMGKDNKDFGFQIMVKRGKTYNFSCHSQVDADKWIETLKVYTNQGLEYDVTGVTDDSIDGSDPNSPPTGMEDPMIGKSLNNAPNMSNNMDIISEFIVETLMKKLWKKKKKHPPQITEEDGCIYGYANILGGFYGDPKKDWQKKWIMIKNHQFSCHKKRGDDYEFSFSLKDIELGAPEQKIIKKGREGALKFHKGSETYMYLEALNPLDVGKIMKQALNAMMISSAASKGSLVRRETTVEKITKFYEALESGSTEQPFARRKPRDDEQREVEEEQDDQDASKKDKKKKDKKDKKKKKKTKKDDIEHPDEPPPDPPQPAKQPLSRQLTENKFKDSDKKHLLDADRLQGEKKEVEARKNELSDIKKDIQNKKKLSVDPLEKANLDMQFKSAQTEWSKCSKRCAEIEEEIEKATKATVPQLLLKPVSEESQLMRNSPASLRRDRDSSDSRRSSGSSRGGTEGLSVPGALASLTSPERECRTSDMSLQEKIKRFQQQNK